MRCKYLLIETGDGFAMVVGALVVLLAVEMLLDGWLTLGLELRATLLAFDGFVVLWIVARHIVQPLLSAPDDDMLALMVERRQPQFRGRLISSIQLTRETTPSSPSLVRTLVAETTRVAEGIDFGEHVARTAFVRPAIAAILLVVLVIAGYVFGRPTSAALLARAFLVNPVQSPQIAVSPTSPGSSNPTQAGIDGRSQKEAELKTLLNHELNNLTTIARDEENLKRETEKLIQPKAVSTN